MSLLPVSLYELGLQADGVRVVVHGFGNVGRYAALAAHELGCRVVGISDHTGGFFNGAGIDIPEAMAYTERNRVLEGFGGGDPITNDELFRLDMDVLIPAAVGGVITPKVAEEVTARVILEGANGPTVSAADPVLNDRGILVVPDILANAGGVTVSYFEWVQDLQNYFWSESEIVGRLREIMSRAFQEVLAVAQSERTDLRTAALIKGIKRVADAKLARGVFP